MEYSQFKENFTRIKISEELYSILQNEARAFLSKKKLGESYDYATGLFVAHLYEVNNRKGGGSGPIETETEGNVSVTYSESKIREVLTQTKHGNLLLDLMALKGSDFYHVPQVRI